MTANEAAFRAAIAAAPLDVAPRHVFADWLDEAGRHEEAAVERAWTVERLAARKEIGDLAAQIGQSYGSLMNVARAWVAAQGDANSWRYTCDNSRSYQDVSWEVWPQFWEAYEVVAGVEVKEKDCPFTCSC